MAGGGAIRSGYTRSLDLKHGRVDLTHGSGGRAMVQLIAELFTRHLGNEYLGQGNDGAVLPAPIMDGRPCRLVMTTDCHVVTPLFFPGGDIGCLSVHGTINDVAGQRQQLGGRLRVDFGAREHARPFLISTHLSTKESRIVLILSLIHI